MGQREKSRKAEQGPDNKASVPALEFPNVGPSLSVVIFFKQITT